MKFEIVYHSEDNDFETDDINLFKEKTDESQKRFVVVKIKINDYDFSISIPVPLDQYRSMDRNIFDYLLPKSINSCIIQSTEGTKNKWLSNSADEEIISGTEIGKLIKENYEDYRKHIKEIADVIYNLNI